MRAAISVLVFCGLSIPSWPQTTVRLRMPVEEYSLQANSFIDALLKISVRFMVPMGVEWVKSADTLKPVQFTRTQATAADVIRVVVSMHPGYEWRMENGVVHVFQGDLARDSRNPLNITISFDEQPETVELANNDLFQMVSHAARTPELPGIAYSRFGSPGEPVFSFAAQSVPARSILNKAVTAGLSAAMPSMKRVWVVRSRRTQFTVGLAFLKWCRCWTRNLFQVSPFGFCSRMANRRWRRWRSESGG